MDRKVGLSFGWTQTLISYQKGVIEGGFKPVIATDPCDPFLISPLNVNMKC